MKDSPAAAAQRLRDSLRALEDAADRICPVERHRVSERLIRRRPCQEKVVEWHPLTEVAGHG